MLKWIAAVAGVGLFVQAQFDPLQLSLGDLDVQGVFGELDVGGSGDSLVTVIDDENRGVSTQFIRRVETSESAGPNPINVRVYCRQGRANPDLTYCLSSEIDNYSHVRQNGAAALNLTPTKRGKSGVRALHATTRDFYENIEGTGGQAVLVAETGILAHGPDPGLTRNQPTLGYRQGIRFVPKSYCGYNREGTRPGIGDPVCPTEGDAATMIGTGFLALVGPQYYASLHNGFAAVENAPRAGHRFDRAFYSETSGEAAMVIRGTPDVGIDMGGRPLVLGTNSHGEPVTLELVGDEIRISGARIVQAAD